MLYQLRVKVLDNWQRVGEFQADNTADALAKPLSRLPGEHMDKPLVLRPKSEPMEFVDPIDPRRQVVQD